ncbi:nuclear fragile X mental retardation-interacting protein 1 [Clonorchis sinensis]|uniref:Nuclear fragile X mental retardation-interacting protein 1 n=1 Tax=Clonorchis sinensis TaxID=79923 RepID=G7Y7Z5_CLOSI|nr:nuclear fragile X mental retardation-interacting protein 1 [Clonorchis sinensis]
MAAGVKYIVLAVSKVQSLQEATVKSTEVIAAVGPSDWLRECHAIIALTKLLFLGSPVTNILFEMTGAVRFCGSGILGWSGRSMRDFETRALVEDPNRPVYIWAPWQYLSHDAYNYNSALSCHIDRRVVSLALLAAYNRASCFYALRTCEITEVVWSYGILQQRASHEPKLIAPSSITVLGSETGRDLRNRDVLNVHPSSPCVAAAMSIRERYRQNPCRSGICSRYRSHLRKGKETAGVLDDLIKVIPSYDMRFASTKLVSNHIRCRTALREFGGASYSSGTLLVKDLKMSEVFHAKRPSLAAVQQYSTYSGMMHSPFETQFNAILTQQVAEDLFERLDGGTCFAKPDLVGIDFNLQRCSHCITCRSSSASSHCCDPLRCIALLLASEGDSMPPDTLVTDFLANQLQPFFQCRPCLPEKLRSRKRLHRRREGLYGVTFDIEDRDYYEPIKYCCDEAFYTEPEYNEHVANHQPCGVDGCPFVGYGRILRIHTEVVHSGGFYNQIYRETSDKGILEWRAARRRNYPTLERAAVKRELLAQRLARGQVFKTAEFGVFELLVLGKMTTSTPTPEDLQVGRHRFVTWQNGEQSCCYYLGAPRRLEAYVEEFRRIICRRPLYMLQKWTVNMEPSSTSQVSECISPLKRHRAADPDDLPPVLFKDGGSPEPKAELTTTLPHSPRLSPDPEKPESPLFPSLVAADYDSANTDTDDKAVDKQIAGNAETDETLVSGSPEPKAELTSTLPHSSRLSPYPEKPESPLFPSLVAADYDSANTDTDDKAVDKQIAGNAETHETVEHPNPPTKSSRGRRQRGGRRRTAKRSRTLAKAEDKLVSADEGLLPPPPSEKDPFSSHPVVQMAMKRRIVSKNPNRIHSRPTLLHMNSVPLTSIQVMLLSDIDFRIIRPRELLQVSSSITCVRIEKPYGLRWLRKWKEACIAVDVGKRFHLTYKTEPVKPAVSAIKGNNRDIQQK